MSAQPRIVQLLDEIRDSTASVYFVPDIFVFDLIQSRFDDIHGIPVVSILETPFLGIEIAVKRASDIGFASLILLVLLVPMVIIAVAVKLTSPGPVIFKQRRYGLNGEEIMVYKFRSMSVCEDGSSVQQAQQNDRRVTPLGKFLRRTSLDELPQFINVLQGRMSIVGPRPHAVAHNELYRKLIKGYMLRHKVKPGITGWAQINGARGETEQIEKMEKRINLDIEYMRNWSLPLDVWIIFKTIRTVIRGDSAY
jgi:putative colanic acid biosynthesis UDP-glucose lipid carrier transferase